jgi:integrase
MVLLLGEAIRAYLGALSAAERSPFYVGIMAYSLRRWEREGAGPLSDAATSINEFLARRFVSLSHNTAVAEFHRFRQFLDYCVARHWLTDNPLRAIRAPRARDTDVDVLTDEQLQSLLAHADAITRVILVILLGSGMRLGELERLRWSDVHGDELVLHGKGGKVRRVAPGRAAMAAMLSLPRTQATVLPFGRSGIDYHLRLLAKKARIPLHAHQIRHTFADHFIRSGGTVEDLAHILGHANLATTMIYIRRHQQERALQAQRLYNPADALFGGDGGVVVPFRR